MKTKEETAVTVKAYALLHWDEIVAYHHDYYLANVEKFKKKAREWRVNNPEAARLADAEYYAAHPEKFQAYRRENADAIRLNNAKRRALQLANTPKDELLTLAQWREIEEYFDHSCAYCGRKLERLTVDHVIPLTQGGKHTKENVVPSCQHCNSSKYNRTPLQWAMSRGGV
jgi:5-methylcytosine-specific restriction endonuclease McrA